MQPSEKHIYTWEHYSLLERIFRSLDLLELPDIKSVEKHHQVTASEDMFF
jgi:hypothetical protein